MGWMMWVLSWPLTWQAQRRAAKPLIWSLWCGCCTANRTGGNWRPSCSASRRRRRRRPTLRRPAAAAARGSRCSRRSACSRWTMCRFPQVGGGSVGCVWHGFELRVLGRLCGCAAVLWHLQHAHRLPSPYAHALMHPFPSFSSPQTCAGRGPLRRPGRAQPVCCPPASACWRPALKHWRPTRRWAHRVSVYCAC